MLLSTKKMGGLRKKKHPKYNFCASIGKIGQNKPNYFGLPPVHPTHTWVGCTGGWDADPPEQSQRSLNTLPMEVVRGNSCNEKYHQPV